MLMEPAIGRAGSFLPSSVPVSGIVAERERAAELTDDLQDTKAGRGSQPPDRAGDLPR